MTAALFVAGISVLAGIVVVATLSVMQRLELVDNRVREVQDVCELIYKNTRKEERRE